MENPTAYDYAKAMGGVEQVLSAKGIWESNFKPVNQFWREYKKEILKLNVAVYDLATYGDLRASLGGGHKTVTLFCHWKNHLVFNSDVKDAEGIINSLDKDQSRVCELIREIVGPKRIADTLKLVGTAECAPSVASILNLVIQQERPLFRTNIDQYQRLTLSRSELYEANRHQIDLWFCEKIITGNRLELRDGLSTAKQIREAISEQFSGLIHLYNCNSSLI